jgi:hypothetical protein
MQALLGLTSWSHEDSAGFDNVEWHGACTFALEHVVMMTAIAATIAVRYVAPGSACTILYSSLYCAAI